MAYIDDLGNAKTHSERAKIRHEREKSVSSPNKGYKEARAKALKEKRPKRRGFTDNLGNPR